MKARHRKSGGQAGTGTRDSVGYADDKSPSEIYAGKGNVTEEADERKKGGRARRKKGGDVKVSGADAAMRADRRPRKGFGGTIGKVLSVVDPGLAQIGKLTGLIKDKDKALGDPGAPGKKSGGRAGRKNGGALFSEAAKGTAPGKPQHY